MTSPLQTSTISGTRSPYIQTSSWKDDYIINWSSQIGPHVTVFVQDDFGTGEKYDCPVTINK
jgi:hypothetical protein